ncbi:hypothetical protein F0L68_12220 [Solihabitans fulvus]|uniref:Uncharacterized protein n=1 Tax=Solihabitans fulvus TaxID=1892852 RepID=A0A5B2XHH1_9PSEU|nr:hypothetical protein [Solihabitans fulvus]KAA2262656.1 hypothetical protein F0L68_12220 [Solihabitans fulvus]
MSATRNGRARRGVAAVLIGRRALPAALLAIACVLAPGPSAQAYTLAGAGTAGGRAGTLIRPDGLIWTKVGGDCDEGESNPAYRSNSSSRVSFTPPQKGVTYVVWVILAGNHPDGNYYPITGMTLPTGPVRNYPVVAEPKRNYLFVQARIGNWVSNSYVVGCTPTRPGVSAVAPPQVIPIWGLPAYNGKDTPGNPNLPPAKPSPTAPAG